jgi:hypothetical protein
MLGAEMSSRRIRGGQGFTFYGAFDYILHNIRLLDVCLLLDCWIPR